MAVNHLVWIRFAPGVPIERVNLHLEALRSLRFAIPGILNLTLGANFTDRAQGYTHGLAVELRDRQALMEYAAHPRHLEVADALVRDGNILVLDYEF